MALRAQQKGMVKAMMEALKIPHYTLMDEVGMDEII